jgi:hypothetical protein
MYKGCEDWFCSAEKAAGERAPVEALSKVPAAGIGAYSEISMQLEVQEERDAVPIPELMGLLRSMPIE